MTDYEQIQEHLGWRFRDVQLLHQAFTHPSVTHEQGPNLPDNQRLEFLGDAVLQLVVTQALFEKYPAYDEGPLTKTRARLVNRHSLARRARAIGLGQWLILSRGEETHGGRDRDSTLADTYEAVVGALFLDAGFEVARGFVLSCFENLFDELDGLARVDNPKGELQELLQAQAAGPPEYELVSVNGPDHDRLFQCVVKHSGNILGSGRGKSKKAAESEAALAALGHLRADQEVMRPQSTM